MFLAAGKNPDDPGAGNPIVYINLFPQ